MRSAAEPAAAVNAVAVLVVAIHGSVDHGGLRQLIETQLLASDRVAAVHGADVSAPPQVPTTSQSAKVLTVDRLRMDLDEMRVSLAGRPIYFTHQEFLLLKTFMLRSQTRLQPQTASGPGLGIWRLGSRPNCRRARPATAGQAGIRRAADRDRTRLRLSIRAAKVLTADTVGYPAIALWSSEQLPV
jgi:hypothetical protein